MCVPTARWGRLEQVMKGLDAAQAAGLRIKINAVALKGFNEDELFSLAEFCAARDGRDRDGDADRMIRIANRQPESIA